MRGIHHRLQVLETHLRPQVRCVDVCWEPTVEDWETLEDPTTSLELAEEVLRRYGLDQITGQDLVMWYITVSTQRPAMGAPWPGYPCRVSVITDPKWTRRWKPWFDGMDLRQKTGSAASRWRYALARLPGAATPAISEEDENPVQE